MENKTENKLILDGREVSKEELKQIKENTKDQIREESSGIFKTYKKLQG